MDGTEDEAGTRAPEEASAAADASGVRQINGLALFARMIAGCGVLSLVGLVGFANRVVGTPAANENDPSWASTFAATLWALATIATAGIAIVAAAIGVRSTREGDDRSFAARLEVVPVLVSLAVALGAGAVLAWLG